jgi:hypothetical protein
MCYEAPWLREPVYGTDDPRAWRNECANPGSSARLRDILNEWKDDYAHLHLIGQPGKYGVRLYTDAYGEEYKVG